MWKITGLLAVALLTMSSVHAQGAASSGQEQWDSLGCWNCHGSDGSGSRRGRPAIAQTPLPLRTFIGRVRLPIWMMPPHTPLVAPEADLATIYHWLGGSDAIRTPLPVTVDLKSFPEIKVTPLRASLRYRVTLITNTTLPEANRTVEYRSVGREGWSTLTISEEGEALLEPGQAPAELRMAQPSARTLVVVEALDITQPDKPVIVGIGTTILK